MNGELGRHAALPRDAPVVQVEQCGGEKRHEETADDRERADDDERSIVCSAYPAVKYSPVQTTR